MKTVLVAPFQTEYAENTVGVTHASSFLCLFLRLRECLCSPVCGGGPDTCFYRDPSPSSVLLPQRWHPLHTEPDEASPGVILSSGRELQREPRKLQLGSRDNNPFQGLDLLRPRVWGHQNPASHQSALFQDCSRFSLYTLESLIKRLTRPFVAEGGVNEDSLDFAHLRENKLLKSQATILGLRFRGVFPHSEINRGAKRASLCMSLERAKGRQSPDETGRFAGDSGYPPASLLRSERIIYQSRRHHVVSPGTPVQQPFASGIGTAQLRQFANC